jgi:hypothetical protein
MIEKKVRFPDLFLNVFWEAHKGYTFRWIAPPPSKKVHVHPQLQNTISPPGHKLISSEILTYPSELAGKPIERKLVSSETLTYPSV